MAVRFKDRRRCRNCPETDEGLPKQIAPPVPATYEGESRNLWKAALVGCSTLFELMFRYVALGVPNPPVSQLHRLHQRLGEITASLSKQESEYRVDPVGGMPESDGSEYRADPVSVERPCKTPADYGVRSTEPSVLID